MITVIRNDKEEKFAHDVYDLKIEEALPNYKIIGATRNEGVTIYESPNYGAVARTFDIIIEAISSGQKSILIMPPVVEKALSKKDFFEAVSNIYDHRIIDDDHHILPNEDMFGRKIEDCNSVYETPQPYNQEFYRWNSPEVNFPNPKNSFNNKYYNNIY